jgi:type IV pilus assembly protein PilB
MASVPPGEVSQSGPDEQLLAKSNLFRGLHPRHREQLRPHFRRKQCAAGTELVVQDQKCDALYLIHSGRVGSYVHHAAGAVSQLVSTIGPAESFPTAALLSGTPSPMTYAAIEACSFYRLGREAFEAAATHSPELAHAVARLLAEETHALVRERALPWVDLARWKFDSQLWANVPASLASALTVCPLKLNGDVMTVAMSDPRDTAALDMLKRALPGIHLRVLAASQDDLTRFIAQGLGTTTKRAGPASLTPRAKLPRIHFAGHEEAAPAPRGASNPPTPAVGLVDEIVATGLAESASDIHIEHERDGVGVRYRVDGALRRRREVIPPDLARPIVSRLKLLAKLDITETRRPQDGRISVRLEGGRMVDLRVSTLPAKFGEKIALRILDSEAAIRDLRTLFPVERVRNIYTQLISRKNGLVLVSGPTGSGKSTTLYSALHARRSDDLNIMTVEDPIEYHIDGITQVEVHPETGTTFAKVLRALLRQDPNIILVGEMRDSETARIAVEASLTGHLVMSSVHTGGAIEAVARLMDMGVEPYAMANGLVGVMHQRLVQRVCSECSQPFEFPPVVMEQLVLAGALQTDQRVQLVRGAGCDRCRGTGLLGRVAVHSVLLVNDEVRDAIARGADLAELKRAASTGAHLDLSRYAGALLRGGYTVPSEVLPLLQGVET